MMISEEFANSLSKAYDIRSEIFAAEDAYHLGLGFGTTLKKQNKSSVVIGYDRRIFSKILYENFIKGLTETGANVYLLGKASTPAVQYMSWYFKADASVAVTASHNPISYHGMKFFIEGEPFCGSNLKKMVQEILQENFILSEGRKEAMTIAPYLNFLNTIVIENKFKVGWECLNGSAGDILTQLNLKNLHTILNAGYVENFGGLAPDPGYKARLSEILSLKTDFSFILDGDADRVCLVYKGEVIAGDVFFSLLAYLEHTKSPNVTQKIVWDSISSEVLKDWVNEFSDNYTSKTGHSNVYKLAVKEGSVLAGELSGHYMYKETNYINDGLYVAIKFIQSLENSEESLEELLSKIPKIFVKKLPNLDCGNFEEKEKRLEEIKAFLAQSEVNFEEFDGVKIYLEIGTISIRASNTENVIRILAEGRTKEDLDDLEKFYEFYIKESIMSISHHF